MTASPTAVQPSPPKPADGGNALDALFAAAAARAMHRQISSPTTQSPASSSKINSNYSKNAAAVAMFESINSSSSSKNHLRNQATTPIPIDQDSANSAAQLIASLINSASKQQQQQKQSPQKLATTSPNKSSINGSSSESTNGRHPVAMSSQLTPKETKIHTLMKTTPVSLTNVSTPAQQQQIEKSTKVSEIEPNNSVELRNLETWHDVDEVLLDESCYQELVDLGNTNGWSADEMFKYNEKRHKITSSYTEMTLGDNYTTPLPKNKSRTAVRMATKLAKEIEDKVQLEGRVTPESSDDDEIFELERTRRNQLKQQKQLDQLKSLKAINCLSIHSQNGRSPSDNYHHPSIDINGSSGSSDGSNTSTTNGHKIKINARRPMSINHHYHVESGRRVSNKSSSQHSNSSTTPVTASLSSSPTLNDSINHHHHHNVIKPVTSSSRNILRTCLT